jgi:uncharacterized protein YdhG (YjbR/CyaY superfamily)
MADKKEPATIDEYISTFPSDVQDTLEKVRQTIRGAAPETVETISYGLPTFKLNGKYVVYFAGWKEHISLYPIPSADEALQKELAPYMSGKGTLKFPLDKPIPYELVKKVVLLLLRDSLERHGY